MKVKREMSVPKTASYRLLQMTDFRRPLKSPFHIPKTELLDSAIPKEQHMGVFARSKKEFIRKAAFLCASLLAAVGTFAQGTQHERTDSHFKGSNPYIDVTNFNVRATSSTPSTRGAIKASSTSLALAGASSFQNGDGIVIRGAGATLTLSTPSAPTVSPSNALVMTGTGLVVANTSGASTYQYQIVAQATNGSYTPASSVTSIANGPASLGSNSVNISSWTASGTTVTVNTSSAHGLVTGAMVFILNAGNANGWWQVTVTSRTQFTFTTQQDTALGASASGGAAGTVTSWSCNHITWKPVTGAFRYLIYGRVSGSMALIGVTLPQSSTFSVTITGDPLQNSFDDFGSTMTANISSSNVPDYIPLTPPASGKNGDLVTTIVSGAGTTNLVLANAATNTVSGATTKFDNTPNIQAAASAATNNKSSQTGFIYIPMGGGFVTNSVLDLRQFPQTLGVIQAGDLFPGDTIILGATQWIGQQGQPSANAQFQLWKLPRITTSTAQPMIYSPGAVGKMQYINLGHNSPSGIIYNVDQGGGIPALELDHVNFAASGSAYMSQHLVFRGDANGGGNITLKNIGSFTPTVSAGSTATPLFYFDCQCSPIRLENFSMNIRGLLFRPSTGLQLETNQFYLQAGIMPLFSSYSAGGTLGNAVDIGSVILDTGAGPLYTWFGTPQGVIKIAGVAPSFGMPAYNGPYSTSAQIAVIIKGSVKGLEGGFNSRDTQTAFAVGIAQDGVQNTKTAPYAASIINGGLSLGSLSQLSVQSVVQAAPTCSVAAGGSVAVKSFKFIVAPVFPGGGMGPLSPSSPACTTTSGNRTITINWTTVPGAIGYALYQNGFSFQCGGAWVTPGSATSYVWSGATPCGGAAPTIPSSGPVLANKNGITTPQIQMVGANLGGTATITAPTLTRNRTQAIPDAAGTFVLDSTLATTLTANGLLANVMTPTSANTLTNKMIDAEGAGNTITLPTKLFMRAAVCNAGKAAIEADVTTAAMVGCFGATTKIGVWQAADGDSITWGYLLTGDFTGSIDGRLAFNSPDTTGTVIFNVSLACVDGSGATADDPAYNATTAFGTVTLAAPANASWTTSVANVTKSGTTTCAAGNWMNIKLTRATDTATSRVNVKGLELTVRRAM